MSVLLSASLAAAAAALLVALPQPGRLRFEDLHRGRSDRPPLALPGGALLPASVTAALVAGVLVAGVLVAVVLGPVAGGLLVLGLLAGHRWHRDRRVRRASAVERRRAVEACGALAGELRAGRAPADALQAAADVAAGPSGAALAAAAAAARLGGDVPMALVSGGPAAPASAVGSHPQAGGAPAGGAPAGASAVVPVLRALAACWQVCSTSGSGLAGAVERLEEALRAEQAQRRAVDAELAGPRATAGLLSVLPVVGLLMPAGLGADPLHVLLATPLGSVCLVLGLGLEGLGLLWTSRLVQRAGGTS